MEVKTTKRMPVYAGILETEGVSLYMQSLAADLPSAVLYLMHRPFLMDWPLSYIRVEQDRSTALSPCTE